MAQVCRFCQSASLEAEDSLRFCTECGYVVEETSFQDELPDFDSLKSRIASRTPCNLEHVAYWMRRASTSTGDDQRPLSCSKRLGLQLLAHCTDHFRFNRSMKTEAINFYQRLVNDTQFTSCTRETKMLLAGVCAYLILNQHDLVITKHAVAKQIGFSIHEFGQVYNRVLQLGWISKPRFFSIDQHISSVLQQISSDDNGREWRSIEQTTLELIRLQQRCRPIESVFAPNLIFATCFYAWKCDDIEHRLKCSLNDFCDRFRLRMNLRKSASAVNKFLLQLVNLLPWLHNRPAVGRSKRMVVYYLKDILEHPNTVVSDYLKKYSSQSVGDSFQSPIVAHQPGEEEEDGDREILDSEIDCYIRNEQEVCLMKKIRERLEREEAEEEVGPKKKKSRRLKK